jgi:hypothetical protein
MIRYVDTKGIIYEKKYKAETTKINLSYKNITKILDIEGLNEIIELHLYHNEIKELNWLNSLVNLRELNMAHNKITEIKDLNELPRLQELILCGNKINNITGLKKLTDLQIIDLSHNEIKEINGLDESISLKTLYLNDNDISEIKGLDKLNNLEVLDLNDNEIKEVQGLEGLINLRVVRLYYNQIKYVPFTVMNLRYLTTFEIDCEINAIIERFLDRNSIKENKNIYNDPQNVHDSSIVKSIKESIYNIMNESKEVTFENISKEIIEDKVLTDKTKSQLIEYCQDKTVHSLLNLTFEEVLYSVWKIIKEHKESQEIKEILNVEMKDSMCKCFTGRLSRLVNCLNGFDERVSIKISDKEQILNVIINIRNKYGDDINKQKIEVERELMERGFDKDVINEYIVYLE